MLSQTATLFIGNYRWDPATQSLYPQSTASQDIHGEVKRLTNKQQALILCLFEAYPSPLSKQDIILSVWGNEHLSAESLPQLISRTRQALEDTQKSLIVNHPGQGYSLNVQMKERASSHAEANNAESAPYHAPPRTSDKANASFTLGRVILTLLIAATAWNLWNLSEAYHYKTVYENILFHTPYPLLETTDNPDVLKVTIDNNACLYEKTTKTLDCP